MTKIITLFLMPLLVFFNNGTNSALTGLNQKTGRGNTGTYKKMIVAGGNVSVNLDLNSLAKTDGKNKMPERNEQLLFEVERDSFLSVVVFNDEMRGTLPGSMRLIPQNPEALPSGLSESSQNLVIERAGWGEPYELMVRDGKTGFVFFYIEGFVYDYQAGEQMLRVRDGRMLMSKEFAALVRDSSKIGAYVGNISLTAALRPIEIAEIVDGEVTSDTMPALAGDQFGGVPGPDVIVGDLYGLAQFGGSNGTQVGLAVGTDSCNAGQVDLNWFALPSNDHPVIPQNLYRMSGGSTNSERFEQIGQSSVKHAFTALTQNLCGFGCNGVGGSRLGSGCSDPYSAGLNAGPNLGSRAWINPFTGAYPRGDSGTSPNNHSGHAHDGTSHRILTNISDLNTSLNAGATYYAEGQYVTPHEYAWCQANPTQCNMYNNVSYRRYNVNGTTSPFSFTPVGATVRTQPAVAAWTGATLSEFRPAAGTDGVGIVAYKVTNPSAGVWHYEYAVYNMNLDRAIQSFSIPTGAGVTISNIGFHAPPQHPGSTFDGTAANTGFSGAPWTPTQNGSSLTWNTETFAQNQNANAIRWGTMYNFRFDSNRPPQTANATVGFFKTGGPITVQVQAPGSNVVGPFSVSGRVTTAGGRGVAYAWVMVADSTGNTRMAITNPFGYYRFVDVQAGGTYTFSVISKQNTFTPRTTQVNDNLTNFDFVAQP